MIRKRLIKYIIFAVVFIYSSQWVAINLLLSSLGKEKAPMTVIQDDEIRTILSDQAGLRISTIKISESQHPFGMMVGIPLKPQLILSRELYNTFSSDAIEYIVLHEAGHYTLWHGVIEFAAGLILFLIGISILKKIKGINKSLITSVLLGLVLGVLMIQLGKYHELQADNYTVKRISNPIGMVEATKSFRDYHGKKYSQSKSPLIQFLFYRADPYENRIKIAEREIKLRQN